MLFLFLIPAVLLNANILYRALFCHAAIDCNLYARNHQNAPINSTDTGASFVLDYRRIHMDIYIRFLWLLLHNNVLLNTIVFSSTPHRPSGSVRDVLHWLYMFCPGSGQAQLGLP